MPGCAAIYCSNSSAKGFLMKRFPMDPERRKLWQIKTRRDKWTPTNNSYLCEIHFAADMWEKTRVDGTRKLKINAVPTIFSFSKDKPARKPPIQRKVPENIKPSMENPQVQSVEPLNEPHNSTQAATSQCAVPSTSTSDLPCRSLSLDSLLDRGNLPSTSDDAKNELTILKYKNLYEKQRLRAIQYKRLLRNCRLQLKNFVKREKMSPQSDESFKQLFNKDQIEALKKQHAKKSTKLMKWSNETITKALKLKFSCGNNGYNELIKQGYPLPSIRTLQRSKTVTSKTVAGHSLQEEQSSQNP